MTRTTDAAVRQARAEAAEAPHASSAAAEERGRLLQRAEATEARNARS
jgi:hypothetical protein